MVNMSLPIKDREKRLSYMRDWATKKRLELRMNESKMITLVFENHVDIYITGNNYPSLIGDANEKLLRVEVKRIGKT